MNHPRSNLRTYHLIHYSLQNPPYIYQWAEKTVPVAEGSSETTTERSQQSTKNRGKAIVTSSAPTYDPEPAMVTEDEEMCNTPKLGRSGIRVRGVLLQDQ
ncbi:hypothetical protein Tco_0301259 [Tanacetum coccineum]